MILFLIFPSLFTSTYMLRHLFRMTLTQCYDAIFLGGKISDYLTYKHTNIQTLSVCHALKKD